MLNKLDKHTPIYINIYAHLQHALGLESIQWQHSTSWPTAKSPGNLKQQSINQPGQAHVRAGAGWRG